MTARPIPLSEREYLAPHEVAVYAGISLSGAYRLMHDLGARRRKRVGLRVRRELVDEYMAPPAPPPAAAPGTPPACRDRDDEEVLPGLTRRQLRERAAGRA